MSRNITVTLADGSQHVYANAPDEITPDQVTARAQQDFGQNVTAMDGGRGATTPPVAPAAPSVPTDVPAVPVSPATPPVAPVAPSAPGTANTPSAQPLEAPDGSLNVAVTGGRFPNKGEGGYDDFIKAGYQTDPTGKIIGPPLTPQQKTATDSANQNVATSGNFLTALKSGIIRGGFGIPERLAAAGERFLPSAITGNTSNADYDQILDQIRANTDADLSKSTSGNILGQILGGTGVGAGAAGLIGKGAGALSAADSGAAQGVGNFLNGLGTLNKGENVANAAKLVATGATAGGAQALGEGTDPLTGAAYGAAGSALLGGGLKAAQVLTRPVRDFLHLSSAGQILSRLTNSTTDQIAARAAEYRDATGAEPTVFETLPLADRNKLLQQAVVGNDNTIEATSNAIRARAANLGPEMQARATQILDPARTQAQTGLLNDLATARGGQNLPGDEALATSAINSPTDMSNFRDTEARVIMQPHDNTPVAQTFSDILPQVPHNENGTITMQDADPAVSAAIRGAVPAGYRAPNQGVSAGDISSMIQTLRGDTGRGGIEANVAQRAVSHLEGVLNDTAPDAAAAHQQMTDAYAARSRMMEGMQAGNATQLRNDVQVGTSRGRAQTVRNAYNTTEGDTGRTLGQGNRILSDLGGSPDEALRATVDVSRNSIGRQLAQNIGEPQAVALTSAAQAQDQSAQALSAASNKAQSGGGGVGTAETLVQAIAGLHPSSFITTKAGAMRKLADMTYIPQGRARTMVDMLFSQDPAMTQRAMNALGNTPNGAKFMQYLASTTGQQTQDQATGANQSPVPAASATTLPPIPEIGEAPVQAAAPTTGAVDENSSPYAPQLKQLYATENPALLALVDRVSKQESGRKQTDAGGNPIVSKKGATGIMQVMPGTAPDAAKLAGLPWDENAYRTDPAYNKLIGTAYLSQLLRKYGGDVSKATAAYNAGPDRVDKSIAQHGDHFIAALPSETQNYVARVS